MNFILVYFKTVYSLPRLNEYYKDIDLFHELMIEQIARLYHSDYKIHVISNVDKPSTYKVIYHYSDEV